MLLKARPHDDLNWEIEGTPKIFEFDLGLEDPYFPLEDELYFHAISKSLSYFTDEVWPKHPASSVILYRGRSDFSEYFSWSESQEANFAVWKEGRGGNCEAHQKRLFCAEAFVSYFQMLAHKLPAEISVRLILEPPTSGSTAEKIHLLSPIRFEHFQIESSFRKDSNIGLSFPIDSKCTDLNLAVLDAYLIKHPSFRPIFEEIMIEQWEGLDEIHYIPEALSPRGERMLKGFEAAGGKRVKIRGRGI